MNKKILNYSIFIMLTILFLGVTNVKAIAEFTCIYDYDPWHIWGRPDARLAIIQKQDGSLIPLEYSSPNNDSENPDPLVWHSVNYKIKLDTALTDANGHLTGCPKWARSDGINSATISDKKNWIIQDYPLYAIHNGDFRDALNPSTGQQYFVINIAETNCESLFGRVNDKPTSPAFYIVIAFRTIKYVGIVLLIVLTLIDFISALVSQDDNAIKKTVNKLGIRAVLCIVLFLLPSFIKFSLDIVSDKQIENCVQKWEAENL